MEFMTRSRHNNEATHRKYDTDYDEDQFPAVELRRVRAVWHGFKCICCVRGPALIILAVERILAPIGAAFWFAICGGVLKTAESYGSRAQLYVGTNPFHPFAVTIVTRWWRWRRRWAGAAWLPGV
jgi:hypothetical protein